MNQKIFVALLLVSSFVASAWGQMAGLPVANDAGTRVPDSKMVSAGLVMGDDLNLYGGRVNYAVSHQLSLFGDMGIVDPDGGDNGWAIQGGGLFCLPFDAPIDLAARGTMGYANLDQDIDQSSVDVNMLTVNASALGSMDVEMLTLYGLLGLNYTRTEVSASGFSDTDTETDPVIGGGAIFALNKQISLYGEVIHIDEIWIGLGGRLAF